MSKQIKGINKLINNIKKFGKEAEKDIDLTFNLVVKEMVADAKTTAPKDTGKLAQSIQSQKIKDNAYLMYVGGVGTKYAPYIEFGTGNKVSLSYLKDIGFPDSYAAKFKGAGVKQVNISPKPYFFPAIIKGQKRLNDDLKDLLKHLTKKYNG